MKKELCEFCSKQASKGRYYQTHESLVVAGDQKVFRGMRTGGYEEQGYECKKCGTRWVHSNDKNDITWRGSN